MSTLTQVITTLPEIHLRSGQGPAPAQVMFVGDCFGNEDERFGEPFMGESGKELNRMMHEAGLLRSAAFCTNVVNAKPPHGDLEKWVPTKKKDRATNLVPLFDKMVDPIVKKGYQKLIKEIALVKPNLIVACGNLALWALTGAVSSHKWRGSLLPMRAPEDMFDCALALPKVLSILPPSAILVQWDQRAITLSDLKRVKREMTTPELVKPEWNYRIRPSYDTVMDILTMLEAKMDEGPFHLSLDLETRAGHMACIGLAWTNLDAISIPLMAVNTLDGYWALEEETAIVYRLYRLLTNPRCLVNGQNLLYDFQYIYRHWHFVPHGVQDTMISHHTAFAGLPKSLDYLASMYCAYYSYWKDDGKTWAKDVGEDQLWSYNCMDCTYTFEIAQIETPMINALCLNKPHEFQQQMFYPVLKAMQRGVRIDKAGRDKFAFELQDEMYKREAYFQHVLGHPLNPRSSVQMAKLFYEDLQQKPIMSKATKKSLAHVTCNDEALRKIGEREALLRPLIQAIQEYRSLGVFLSTFVLAPLDIDGRMRTSYNICGTETFRLSSSENAFGSGTNLQNVPSGSDEESGLSLPNVRKLFLPDPGFEMFDIDLSKADLRVVAWESDESEMKAMLAEGRDPYIEAAREYFKDPTIKKSLPNGNPDPRYKQFKAFAHGTHYLQTPNGLAARQGMTVYAAAKLQAWYFGKYPKIKTWQEDFKKKVASRRYVENRFGYRRYYFERITEDTYREAIAWVPQSTVGIYINKVWMAFHEHCPEVQVLLQVHDSLVGQFPAHKREKNLADMDRVSQIVVPYSDPLIIPVGVKTSTVSWGDCS